MKTGRLLDILSGHEGPVHGLMFSPTNVSLLILRLIVCLFSIDAYAPVFLSLVIVDAYTCVKLSRFLFMI